MCVYQGTVNSKIKSWLSNKKRDKKKEIYMQGIDKRKGNNWNYKLRSEKGIKD